MQSTFTPLCKYFLYLRLLTLLTGITVLVTLPEMFDLLRRLAAITILGCTGLSIIVYAKRLVAGWQAREQDARRLLAHDCLLLVLLHLLIGVPFNMFAALLLVPLGLAASLFELRRIWPLFVIAGAGYAGLPLLVEALPTAAHGPSVGLRWLDALAFIMASLAMLLVGARVERRLKQQRADARRLRERALRGEQRLGIALLAAEAEHGLTASLNTLDFLLAERLADGPAIELHADLQLMQQEVLRCRQTLARLTQAAFPHRAEAEPLKPTLQRLIQCLLLIYPRLHVELEWPDDAGPTGRLDILLEHALLNLLQHAADASTARIAIRIDWHAILLITIDNDEAGPSELRLAATPTAIESAERPPAGTTEWLSNSSLERFGGRVRYTARASGGTRMQIELPLESVQRDKEHFLPDAA